MYMECSFRGRTWQSADVAGKTNTTQTAKDSSLVFCFVGRIYRYPKNCVLIADERLRRVLISTQDESSPHTLNV